MNVLLSFIKLNEYVIHDDTKYACNDVHLPTFLSKEDVIDDIPSQEIFIETLYHETMVMSSSHPMTLVLCQVVPYPPFKENEKFKEKEIPSKNGNISHPLIEYGMNDASSYSDEDIH